MLQLEILLSLQVFNKLFQVDGAQGYVALYLNNKSSSHCAL